MQTDTKNAIYGCVVASFVAGSGLVIINTQRPLGNYSTALLFAAIFWRIIEALAVGLISYVFMTISPVYVGTSSGIGQSAKDAIVGGIIGAVLMSMPALWGVSSNPKGLGEILTIYSVYVAVVGVSGYMFARYELI